MDEATAHAARRTQVSKYLTDVSLLAKDLCPEAKVEATTEHYEDEDGHVRSLSFQQAMRREGPKPCCEAL